MTMNNPPPQDQAFSAATDTSGLEFQTSLVRAINESSPDGILVVSGDGVVVSHNQRFLHVMRIPDDYIESLPGGTAIGKLDQSLLSLAVERVLNPESFLERVRELYADPEQDDHCEIELRDGRTLERHSTVLRSEHGKYLGRVWFFRDITERKRTETALRELAHHDPLTGVPNRRLFFVSAAREFARARRSQRPLSLISIDIDHFKNINDQYGHAAGDEVLKSLSYTWGRLLREVDLLSRLGGEEFAVLLPDTALVGAHLVAERLRQSVAQHEVTENTEEIRCTISAGVSTLQPADASIDDILRRADESLYRAKKAGRNRVEDDV
jgi:diguanylate cyclase (GGDEF)-like protein